MDEVRIGEHVRVVVSVVDPPWLHADNRVIVDRVAEDPLTGFNRFYVRIPDGILSFGPYALSDLVAGWSDDE